MYQTLLMQASTPSFVLKVQRCCEVKVAGAGSGERSFSVAAIPRLKMFVFLSF